MKLIGSILTLLLLLSSYGKVSAQALDTICKKERIKTYRVMPTPGSKYFWTAECGIIISKNVNADSVVIEWCKSPGTYHLSVIEQNRFGCWGDTVRALIIINGDMNFMTSGPSEICGGDIAWLQASGADNYLWSTGEKTNQILVKSQDSVARYWVVGSNLCSRDTVNFTVNIYPKPVASFTYQPKQAKVDENIFIHYTGKNAYDWFWYFGNHDSTDANVSDPEVSFKTTGDKTVTLVARNKSGCTDTVSYRVHIAYDSKLYVPNSFTPNDDGVNDVFKAVGYNIKSFHMQIYNRWGELIFESFNMDDAWDGTFKGAKVIESVYLYMIDAHSLDNEAYYLSGPVTVIY